MHRGCLQLTARLASLCLACLIPRELPADGPDVPADAPFAAESPWLTQESVAEGNPFAEHLETDRDSFTPATTVVGRRRVLVESSYSFIENHGSPESHSFPEILTRVGLSPRTELRIGWNYEAGGGGSVSGSELGDEDEFADVETEAQLLYGFKTAVTAQAGWRPESAVFIHATTPTAGVETATQISTAYVFGWTLPDDWKLDAAMRYGTESEAGDHFHLWAPSVVLRVPVRERWNVHAEYFGIFTQDKARDASIQYFSPGVHYLLTPDCEIGVRVGWGLTDDAARYFTNVGLGVRF